MSTAKCILHGTAPTTPVVIGGSIHRPSDGFDTFEGSYLCSENSFINNGDPVNPPGYGTSNLWATETTIPAIDGSGVVELGVRAEGFLLYTQTSRSRSETVIYVKHYGTHTYMVSVPAVRVWSVDAIDMLTLLGRAQPSYVPGTSGNTPEHWTETTGWYVMEARGRNLAEGLWLNETVYTKTRIPEADPT